MLRLAEYVPFAGAVNVILAPESVALKPEDKAKSVTPARISVPVSESVAERFWITRVGVIAVNVGVE